MVPFENDVSTKRFASIVATMIDARLIYYKHYYLWADELIETVAEPPLWIIDIATIRYPPEAVTAIARFIKSDPIAEFESTDDFRIACMLLRYRIGEISWATFLSEAGSFADGAFNCRVDCAFFYELLNDLEDDLYSTGLAERQAAQVQAKFHREVEEANLIFSVFLDYFRRYVKKYMNSWPAL